MPVGQSTASNMRPYIEALLRQMGAMRREIEDLKKEVQAPRQTKGRSEQERSEGLSRPEMPQGFSFHLSSREEPECLNQQLAADKAVQRQLELYLYNLRGITYKHSLHAAGSMLLTPDRTNRSGQNKANFSQLQQVSHVLFSWCSASVCGKEDQLTAWSGAHKLIFFPYYSPGYSVNQTCSWKITTANDNEVVRLIVIVRDLEGGDGCPNDSLSIYDADGPVHDRRLAKLCGFGRDSKTFNSTGRYMYIHLVTSGNVFSKSVKLLYTALKREGVPRSTTPRTLTAEEHRYVKAQLYRFYTLKSPNYPASYFSYESILWNIVCDPGYVVRLQVVEMDLQSSRPCGENRVTVYDSDKTTVLAIMCNYQFQGVDLYSTGGGLYVHFTSGLASTGKGFSMAYQAVRPYDAKPWTTRSLRSTTTTSSSKRRPNYSSSTKRRPNYAILIGTVGGLGVLLVLICVTCMLCRRGTRPSRPRVGRPAASTLRSAAGSSTTRPSNMSVYIASRPSTTPRRTVRFTTPADPPRPYTIPQLPVTAHTNLAFSAYGEDPPPYSSLQLTPQPSQPASAVSLLHAVQLEIEPRPPPYSESMIVTYPPSYKEVTDDAAGQ